MNRKELIKLLDKYEIEYEITDNTTEVEEGLRLLDEALEKIGIIIPKETQVDTIITENDLEAPKYTTEWASSSDSISRQATIRAICQECAQRGYDECSVDCLEAEILRKLSSIEPMPAYENAISRQDAIEALDHINIPTQAQREYAIEIFEDIPQVEPKIYGNEHNCIMTMFGECSYSETGCGSCEVVEKVRNALKGECPPVEPKWPKGEWQSYRVENPDMVDGYVGGYACSECGEPSVVDSPFCAWCGADMRGDRGV